MKKWIMCVLLLVTFCMMSGCKDEENSVDSKYGEIPKDNLSEVIEEDMQKLGYYEFSSLTGFDSDSIERYLENFIYGVWYERSEDTSIEIDEAYFDGTEYGVCYVIKGYSEELNEYSVEIIKMYEIGRKEAPFYLAITTDFEEISCLYMSCYDANGTWTAEYQSKSQQELDEQWESWQSDFEFYEEPDDGYYYKVEASSIDYYSDNTYKDMLRNPSNYYGAKVYESGTVIYEDDDVFVLKNISGRKYAVYPGENTPNVIEDDLCIIFGEVIGKVEYITYNEYGTASTQDIVALSVPYVITCQETGEPFDSRMLELFYGTYERNTYGGNISYWNNEPISIDENTIGIVGSNNRYTYSATFGDVKVSGLSSCHYTIPITLSYYVPETGATITATGKFFPWERELVWYKADSEEFLFVPQKTLLDQAYYIRIE